MAESAEFARYDWQRPRAQRWTAAPLWLRRTLYGWALRRELAAFNDQPPAPMSWSRLFERVERVALIWPDDITASGPCARILPTLLDALPGSTPDLWLRATAPESAPSLPAKGYTRCDLTPFTWAESPGTSLLATLANRRYDLVLDLSPAFDYPLAQVVLATRAQLRVAMAGRMPWHNLCLRPEADAPMLRQYETLVQSIRDLARPTDAPPRALLRQ